jgi:hypothetical protein
MEFKEKAASADWVSLQAPDSTASMWFAVRANGGRQTYPLTAEQAAKYDLPPAGVCFAAPPGDDFEVRWELPPDAGAPETAATCRLMLQLAPAHAIFPYTPAKSPLDGVSHWFSIRIKTGAVRGTVDVSMLSSSSQQVGAAVTVEAKARSKVVFRLSRDFVSLSIDNQPVFDQEPAARRVYDWPQTLIAFATPTNPAERPGSIAVRIPSKSDPEQVAQVNP